MTSSASTPNPRSAIYDPPFDLFLSPPHMSGRELAAVEMAFDSNYIAPVGPFIDEFERSMADYLGVAECVALSSGTAALHLALRAVGVGPGDRVFCSTLTFCASANPILYQGADPVFIDADSRSWNIDVELLADALRKAGVNNRLPKAIIAVDLYGQSVDMSPLLEVAGRYDVPVIDDAAEALGATYEGRPVGSHALFSAFSFNGNKIITTGGGGMLCSNDRESISHCRFLATQARDPASHYQHSTLGYNYRMSNVAAAIGVRQLEALPQRVERRRRIFERYREQLGRLPGIEFMPEAAYGRATRWLTTLQIDEAVFGATAEQVRLALEAERIEARPAWKPLHLQPLFAGAERVGGTVAERIFRSGLCLPSGSAMSDADVDRVCRVIRAAGRSSSATSMVPDAA